MERRVLRDDLWERIKDLLPGKVKILESRPRTIGCSWKPCCGWPDGGAVAGFAAGTGPLAHHFHALCTLDPVGYLGSCVPNGQCRPGLRRSHDRQHRDLRPPACRWRPKKRGPQALGRSCGGFGTQIHSLVDALGNPIGFTLTGAEQADISQAPALLDQAPSAGTVIADEGYDADAWVERLESQQVEAVIPPRSNRKSPRDYDRHRYKARNLVERFFNPLKQFRRIATRYEKLAAHFTAMVICGCIMQLLTDPRTTTSDGRDRPWTAGSCGL